MLKELSVNTGEPRNVLSHMISGAIATSIISGAINYKKVKKGEMTKNDAIRNTSKVSTQGGIATAAAVSVSNHIGTQNGILKACAAAAIGAASVYGVEILAEKINAKKDEKEQLIIEDGILIEGEE